MELLQLLIIAVILNFHSPLVLSVEDKKFDKNNSKHQNDSSKAKKPSKLNKPSKHSDEDNSDSGDWSWTMDTTNHPLGWLMNRIPGMSKHHNISIQMTTDKKGTTVNPDCQPGSSGCCPDPDELCDLSCRDFGKSGGMYAYKQWESDIDRFSCLCFCSPPPNSKPFHGSIFPCTEDRVCDNLCRHNAASWQYVSGGSCIRNVCQCNCDIQDPYDPSKPFYEHERFGWHRPPPYPIDFVSK